MTTKPLNRWKGVGGYNEYENYCLLSSSPQNGPKEELFDTEAQTKMMMNTFTDPLFLRIGEPTISSGEISNPDGVLIPSVTGGCIDE